MPPTEAYGLVRTYDERVEWRRRWLVTLRTARPGAWPRSDTREIMADTPTQLRHLIEAARADIRVLAYSYRPRRELVGDLPTHCPAGHQYLRHSDVYPLRNRDWLACACGGHAVFICAHSTGTGQCLRERIEPLPAYDCDVTWPRRTHPQTR